MRRVVVLTASAWAVVISPTSALLLARRAWLQRACAPLLLPGSALAADLPAQQATGNVRDGADIDAAIGITWGGRERCDANNPLCGPDGQLLAEAPKGAAVPATPAEMAVTDMCELDLQIGKYNAGTIRLGLFGDQISETAPSIRRLCSSGYRSRVSDYPTTWQWGTVTEVELGKRVRIGLPSQAQAYARRLGRRTAPEDFVDATPPQTTDRNFLEAPKAGFVVIPEGGLNDKFELTFLTSSTTTLDQVDKALGSAIVVGKIMDEEGMKLLARLESLPVQRAYGKNGSPIAKTYVTEVRLKKP